MRITRIMNSYLARTIFAAVLIAPILAPDARAEYPSFRDLVSPILGSYCLDCHQPGGDGYDKSGLDLRTYESLMKGTKFGPVVKPGDAFTSNLMVLIEGRADKSLKMPHGSYRQEPTRQERKVLRDWIKDGALQNAAFWDQVNPVLQLHCLECHLPGGIGYETSGLDMRTYEGIMKGTNFGPVIVPGDPFTSNLMVLIEGRSKFGLKMPYVTNADLSKWEKHLIRVWINRGAKNN